MKIRVYHAYDFETMCHRTGEDNKVFYFIDNINHRSPHRRFMESFDNINGGKLKCENYSTIKLDNLLLSLHEADNDRLMIYPELGLNEFKITNLINEIIRVYKDTDKVFNFYTDSLIFETAWRVAIFKKELSKEDVEFIYYDKDENKTIIEVNEFGQMVNHVDGWFDEFDNQLNILIGIEK